MRLMIYVYSITFTFRSTYKYDTTKYRFCHYKVHFIVAYVHQKYIYIYISDEIYRVLILWYMGSQVISTVYAFLKLFKCWI